MMLLMTTTRKAMAKMLRLGNGRYGWRDGDRGWGMDAMDGEMVTEIIYAQHVGVWMKGWRQSEMVSVTHVLDGGMAIK